MTDQSNPPAAPAKPLPVTTKRKCGSCTACCTVLGVPQLKKGPWVACEHCQPNRTSRRDPGCRIYAERPNQCQQYHCLWLAGFGKREHRPNDFGVIFDIACNSQQATVVRAIEEKYKYPVMLAREVWQGAFAREEVDKALRRIAQKAVLVLLYANTDTGKGMRTVMGPDEVMGSIEQFLMEAIHKAIPAISEDQVPKAPAPAQA